MPLILPARTLDSGNNINNSCRFNQSDHCLTKTFGSAGNRKTWTFSVWFKRSNLITAAAFFVSGSSGQSEGTLRLQGHQIDWQEYNVSTSTMDGQLITNQVLRDVSAWYHLVCVWDSTDSTAGDRMKMFLNGSEITSFGTDNNPTEDYDSQVNNNVLHNIGRQSWNNASDFDGYMSDINFIDGSALTASSFGEFDEDSGIWKPKKYDGSYGTNGFFLEFKQSGTGTDSSGIGADTSGEDNHWAVTHLAATDQTTDTPTNNFATLNPLNKLASPVTHEGNLEYDSNSSGGSSIVSTIAPSNGKWYVEIKALTSTIHIGVSEVGKTNFAGQGASRPNINYQYGGGVEIDGSIIDTEASFTTDDIIGFALNLDDGELTIYKNGTALNSGTAYNLHTNTTHGNTGFSVQTATSSGNTKASFNFGNPAFAISSGNADANGYGNFEYAVPSGYYALCTKNLAVYG